MKFVSCSLALLATFATSTCAAWNEDLANAKFVANALDEGKNLHALGLRGAANSETSALGDFDEEMDQEHDVLSLEGAIATADLNFMADAVEGGEHTDHRGHGGGHGGGHGDWRSWSSGDCIYGPCNPNGQKCCGHLKCRKHSSAAHHTCS
jgi:hypothetical protein